MSRTIFVTASPGLVVIKPDTQKPLASEGETVPYNSFWIRRLQEGDVVQSKPLKAKSPAAAQE